MFLIRTNELSQNSADYDKLYQDSCSAQHGMRQLCLRTDKPGQNQTINEGIIAFKCRLSYMQY